jgi:putative membrane-bound dehydrogenase-like protein
MRTRNALFVLLAILTLTLACNRTRSTASLDPKEFIAASRIAPGLELQLAAREPNVVDPVAIAFDADGRMFVVEMRDYPTGMDGKGAPGGRVRLLEDADGDGYFEKSTLFADGLQYPTSVLPWRGGVLVTSPPDIVFLKDNDGDGRADERTVVLTGFPVDNTQHNINGLIWGLDNWVYGANGGNRGTARSPRAPERAVPLERADFRFRPETGEVATSYESTGGFGIAFDAWGHMFGTHNTDHIQHVLLRREYLARNPHFAVGRSRHVISDHGASAELFQISEPEMRFNHPEQSGHFSGGCGLTYYEGGALGPAYDRSFLVADVVVNVVHRDVVEPDGPTFRARRAEERAEFLAGKDNWFRPVFMATGPEGALYLADMHRAVIEHPEWIPDVVEQKLNVRAGDDKGRIYRIVPRGGLPTQKPALSRASVEDLVAALGNANRWRRETAQRLLVERKDPRSAPLLVRAFRESSVPVPRLHALWTLDGLDALTAELVSAALADSHPGIRENALRMAETRLPELGRAVAAMTADPDARVRFQLALTLGRLGGAEGANGLVDLARRDAASEWSRIAILASLDDTAPRVLDALLRNREFAAAARDSKERQEFVRRLAGIIGARQNADEIAAAIAIARAQAEARAVQTSLLDGLADGLQNAGESFASPAKLRDALAALLASPSTPVVRASLRVAGRLGIRDLAAQSRALERARTRAADAALATDDRLAEIELLGLGTFDQTGETLLALMDPRQPREVQAASARVAARIGDEAFARAILGRWRTFSPQVKSITLQALLEKRPFHDLLLRSLETKQLTFGELNLDLEQRRRLLRRSTEDIHRRAAALFGDQEFSNRKAVVDQFLPKVVPLAGDTRRGETQFRNQCAKCHRLRGIGFAVGPDLGMAFAKAKEDLLTSILDPNTAIEPQYTSYVVTTLRGDEISGLIKTETPSSITLVRAGGESDTVLRNQIRVIRTDGLSLMPEGLEKGLTAQDFADLIAFLRERESS